MNTDLSIWEDEDLCQAYEELKNFSKNGVLVNGIAKEYAVALEKEEKGLEFSYSIAEIYVEEEMAKRFYKSNKPKEINVDEIWDKTLKLCDALLYKMEHGNTEEAVRASYKARRLRNIFEPIFKRKGIEL